MITRNPYDRNDLKIGKKDRVLEVGPGHSPIFRSDVLVDLFVDTNYHRCGNLKIYPHQEFINADGESLPFKDKEFDYVICNQVLEHAENPENFIGEQMQGCQEGVYGNSQSAGGISLSQEIAQMDYSLSGR